MGLHQKYIIFTAAIFCMVAVLLCPTSAHAAWTRKQGDAFGAETLSYYSTTHFIDNSGRSFRQPEFTKLELNSYYEYGWRDDVTLGANLFAHRLTSDAVTYSPTSPLPINETNENYGLADSEFFLRKRLWQGTFLDRPTVVSVQPLIKLPSLYSSSGNPRGGTDNFDAELRLQAGYNFPAFDRTHFATFDFAYRKRFGDWGDQFKADTTFGLNITDDFTVLIQSFLTQRVDETMSGSNNIAAVNDYDLLKTQISVIYRLTPSLRLQLGGYRHMQVRNTGDGKGYLLSIWRDF